MYLSVSVCDCVDVSVCAPALRKQVPQGALGSRRKVKEERRLMTTRLDEKLGAAWGRRGQHAGRAPGALGAWGLGHPLD